MIDLLTATVTSLVMIPNEMAQVVEYFRVRMVDTLPFLPWYDLA